MALVLSLGCDARTLGGPARPEAPDALPALPTVGDASASVDASPAHEPLAGAEQIDLDVPGFKAAVVSVPVGATSRRPVMVAVHGIGDRPDWQCIEMRNLLQSRAFVLCPRGVVSTQWSTPADTRYAFLNGGTLTKEIEAGLAALRSRFADYVDDGPMLYEGFSFGANAGVGIVTSEPSRFPRVILTEGGTDGFTAVKAKAFADHGGKRVLLACGQAACDFAAKQVLSLLRKAGVEARSVYGAGEGHGYGGAVASGIRGELAWLLEGDARFSP